MAYRDVPIEQELLAHQAFLKRLATDLVGADAEDLVQDVWQRALERPPQSHRLRGWLARVARNLSANRWRDEARRREREQRRAEPSPTQAELETHLEMRKELVAALDALCPTHRETILLRYFEGLAPRDIAERQAAPVSTVKTRLQRGLAQLRTTLDERRGGERNAWVPAVTALGVTARSQPASGALGGIVMGMKMKLGAAALVVGVAAYFAPRPQSTEPLPVSTVEPAVNEEGDETALDETRPANEVASSGERQAVAEELENRAATRDAAQVLRVVVEGLSEDAARQATVTVKGRGEHAKWNEVIRESWPLRGRTSEYELTPFLARVEDRVGHLRDDLLTVDVDAPSHFGKSVHVSLSKGERQGARNVHEARVRFLASAFWPELALAVRDAHTREHLDQVELRCVTTALMGVGQQPGVDGFTWLGEGLSSPIALRGGHEADDPESRVAGLALRPGSGKEPEIFTLWDQGRPRVERGLIVFARAPGYAWGRVILNLSSGGERELLLDRGAALELRLANLQFDRYAELDVQPTLTMSQTGTNGREELVWQQDIDESLASEGLRLQGLVPGELAIRVELSRGWKRKAIELAFEQIPLAPGEERELLVTVADAPEPAARADLSGTISLPHFGGEDGVRLELFGSDYLYGDPDDELALSDQPSVAGALPSWSFHLENLPVDRYQLRLRPFLTSWMIELPPGGRDDVELTIPELAEVYVETVDARSGQRVGIESLAFRTLETQPLQVTHPGSPSWTGIPFEDEPGRFRFWTSPGTFRVQTNGIPDDLDYGDRAQDLELGPGLQSLRLELSPPCTLHVEFRVDGVPLPHEDKVFHDLTHRVRPVGHDGHVTALTYWFFKVSDPGLYEFDFEGLGADRFLPIPPRRVPVRPGETAEVIVELQRK